MAGRVPTKMPVAAGRKTAGPGLFKSLATLSGIPKLASDAKWAVTHPKERMLGQGRAANSRMEVAWGPGRGASWLEQLGGVKAGRNLIDHPLGDTGLQIREPVGNWQQPFFTHSGEETTVGKMLRNFMPDIRDKVHPLQILTAKGARKPESNILPEDIMASFTTGSNLDSMSGMFHEGFIKPQARNMGLYGTSLQGRTAQAGSHLGQAKPLMDTMASMDAIPGMLSQASKGTFRLGDESLKDMMNTLITKAPKGTRNSPQLVTLQKMLDRTGMGQNLPPEALQAAMQALKVTHPRQPGLNQFLNQRRGGQ